MERRHTDCPSRTLAIRLAEAEAAMLDITCRRARINDAMRNLSRLRRGRLFPGTVSA